MPNAELLSNSIVRTPQVRSIRPNTTPMVAESGISIVNRGVNQMQQTVLSFDGLAVTLTDEAGAGQSGGKKLVTLPEGVILINSVFLEGEILLVAPFIDAANVEVAIATAAVAGGAALGASEKDVLAIAGAAATAKLLAYSKGAAALTAFHDGRVTPVALYLNFRVADDALHDTTPLNLITGSLVVNWTPVANAPAE